jgi:hypothetical protein
MDEEGPFFPPAPSTHNKRDGGEGCCPGLLLMWSPVPSEAKMLRKMVSGSWHQSFNCLEEIPADVALYHAWHHREGRLWVRTRESFGMSVGIKWYLCSSKESHLHLALGAPRSSKGPQTKKYPSQVQTVLPTMDPAHPELKS